jgi:hypothetical protein
MDTAFLRRAGSVLPILLPLMAIVAARAATHSDLAARNPRAAALLFLWIAADSLALAAIAKAPANRPGIRALLGAIAAGCIVATVGAAAPVREALLDLHLVTAAMGLTVTAFFGWSFLVAVRELRNGATIEQALSGVLPPQLVRFAAHELKMVRLALFRWGSAPHVPEGATGYAYHHVINPMVAAFLVLQLIEILVVDILVGHWSERAAMVLLAFGLWGALFLIALMKAFRIYPVLLAKDHVRVRAGTLIDVCVPLVSIDRVETAITREALKSTDILDAAILAHPNVVLCLASPIEYRPLFGRARRVVRVAFRLDQPEPFLRALQETR